MTAPSQSIQEAFNKVIQLCEAGHFVDAEQHCDQILQIAPDQPDTLHLLGMISSQLEKYERAIECFQKLTQFRPQDSELHFNLAKVLQKSERFPEAKESFESALQYAPNDSTTLINYGHVCKNLDDWDHAFPAFRRATELKRAPAAPSEEDARTFKETTRAKLRHDIEQLNYLKDQKIPPENCDEAISLFTDLKNAIPADINDTQTIDIPPEHQKLMAPFYNRLISLEDSDRLSEGALNPNLNRPNIEEGYKQSGPGIVAVDDFLTPAALDGVRRFCLASSIWFEYGYTNGYLGAFMEDGFLTPLLLQIAEELAATFPEIFEDHHLSYLWAYKYDCQLTGINLHGDDAVINVNFWITPDEANRDPETGGLIVWDKEAPDEWDFKKVNTDYDAMRSFLKETNANKVRIPHKQNRAVIFNSDLFHETDTINFHEGYENRRINITMLFGRNRHA